MCAYIQNIKIAGEWPVDLARVNKNIPSIYLLIPMAKIHIDIPDDIKTEFSAVCKRHNTSMTKVVVNHIKGYCKRFRRREYDRDE